MDGITVITLSRNRPVLLKWCTASVQNQDYAGKIQHLILVDNCWETASFLKEEYQSRQHLTWMLRGRNLDESSGPIHLARLRNLGIRMAETAWICFLDDDNEYEPFYLSKLIEVRKKIRESSSAFLDATFSFWRETLSSLSWKRHL